MTAAILTAWLLLLASTLTTAAFVLVERRTRMRWRTSAVVTVGPESPYRAATQSVVSVGRAPTMVRAAALVSILLGSTLVPGVLFAMATLRFDGIALSLLPEIASAAVAWCAGWLLLGRARVAVELSRLSALASTTNGVMLLVLALLHTLAARMGWSDRASPLYVYLATGLAISAVGRGALLRAAMVTHASAFDDTGSNGANNHITAGHAVRSVISRVS